MGALTQSPVMDIQGIKEQFPVLQQQVHGKNLIYFDNAATTQKPRRVIESLVGDYEGYNANIHRGIHTLAEKATKAFEETRRAAQLFIGARDPQEGNFTPGWTRSGKLVSSSYGRA